MTALIIKVGTVDDVPDLQLPSHIGHVDPPGPSCSKWMAYFVGGGAMAMARITPDLWWAVPTGRVDVSRVLGHLGADVKTLNRALRDSEAAPTLPRDKLANVLVNHSANMWREELAVEGDDTTAVVGIRGPGGGRRLALSGQDLGTDEAPKEPTRIHTRTARKIPVIAEVAPI